MTDSQALKRIVRERMAATGENYTRALRAVLAERDEDVAIAEQMLPAGVEVLPEWSGGFYEDDEPVADVVAAFDQGEKGVTREP